MTASTIKRLAVTYVALLPSVSLLHADDLLPAPTGPHKTGRVSLHWKDQNRDELETSATGDKRELMVHLFYPADEGAVARRAVYVPDADAMRGPWNESQLTRIAAMRAYSLEKGPILPGAARFPVLIFSPGGGMKGLTYHVLLEDLASHGWIVAAIDPPYNARAVRFPDGRVLGNLRPEERGWPQPRNPEEGRRFYRERIVHWARDVSFVIDQLAALDGGDGPFGRRLDLARGVGVFGHSRGGQAAGTVRLLDERVKGGVNIDGAAGDYAIMPAKEGDMGGAQPFLWIQGSLPQPPTDAQLRQIGRTRAEFDAELERTFTSWSRNLGSVTGGAIRLYVDRPGITHIDFSDEPFWNGSLNDDNRPGIQKTITDTRTWLRAFFDGSIRGEWAGLKRLAEVAGRSDSDVTVQIFGKMWP